MKKRILTLLIGVILCLLVPLTASAQDPKEVFHKTYALHISQTHGSITTTPTAAAFWEYPVLKRGEDYAEGTFTVKNNSTHTASMTLNDIPLPYGDATRMAYLNELELTVSEGDTVLFDGTYAHVNDSEGGLHIAFEKMAPGEEHTYTVKLRCRYTYTGDPTTDVTTMMWGFTARASSTTYEVQSTLPEWVDVVLKAMVATIVLLLVIAVMQGIFRWIKHKKSIDK